MRIGGASFTLHVRSSMEAIGPASEQAESWLTLYAMWKGAFALNLSSNLSLMSGWAKALNAWCVFANSASCPRLQGGA